jgi:bifunctional ADP-heptose synthase (sugar kinase/adenylyltransferase)
MAPEKRDDTLSREQLVAKAESEVSAWLTTRSENGSTVTDPALAVPLL